jgi:mRNA interferase RelE/StbE
MTTEIYALEYTGKAEAHLEHLDRATAERVAEKILWLAANAAMVKHHALTGEWAGLYRLRVGDYRVIYDLDCDARLVVVVAIGHRRDLYKT